MYYVYILQSQKGNSYYTGITNDLEKRLKDHNWHTVKATKAKAPYKIVWHCAFEEKSQSIEFEKYLKTGSGIAFRNKHLL